MKSCECPEIKEEKRNTGNQANSSDNRDFYTRGGDLTEGFFACYQKIDTPESFVVLLIRQKKLAMLSLLKEF